MQRTKCATQLRDIHVLLNMPFCGGFWNGNFDGAEGADAAFSFARTGWQSFPEVAFTNIYDMLGGSAAPYERDIAIACDGAIWRQAGGSHMRNGINDGDVFHSVKGR